MRVMAPQITSLTAVYLAVYSGVYQRKHQSSASLAFVRGIHRGPVNSPHKRPVTRKMFPFDDVIMHDVRCNSSEILHRARQYHSRALQNFKTIGWLRKKLWANEISHLILRCDSDGYPILHRAPELRLFAHQSFHITCLHSRTMPHQ